MTTLDYIDPTKDFYGALGVAATADAAAVKLAYKRLAIKYHPDRGGDIKKMQALNEAHDILKDPVKRATYDRLRAELASGAGAWSFDYAATKRYDDLKSFFADPANANLRTFVRNSLFMFQEKFGARIPEAVVHDFESAVEFVYAAWDEIKEAGAYHYENFAGFRVRRRSDIAEHDNLND
jgi:curved DNA-binding protein CbpA